MKSAFLTALSFSAVLFGQTTVPLTLTFAGSGAGNVKALALSGSGTIAPYGKSTITIAGAGTNLAVPLTFSFVLNTGDSLSASSTATPHNLGFSGTATITGGSGSLANSTGSFTYQISGSSGSTADNVAFTLTGSGNLKNSSSSSTGAAAAACFNGTSSESGVCTVIVCFDGSGSGSSVLTFSASGNVCGILTFDGGGGSGNGILYPPPPPVLSFDGGGGSGNGVLTFDGGGGGGNGILYPPPSPVLTFDGGGGSGSGILRHDGGGGSGGGVLTFTLSTIGASTAMKPASPHADAATGTASGIYMVTPAPAVPATFMAVANCPASPSACWISIPPSAASGTIPALTKIGIPAIVTLPSTAPGVYFGSVTLTLAPRSGSGTPVKVDVPIKVIVAPEPVLTPSQAAVQFQALAGTAGALTQTVAIKITGAGSPLPFTATPAVLSGGEWLTASAASSQLTLQANPAGLAPGTYFGRVDLTGSAASGLPQSIEAVLTVLAANATATPVISPTALVFVAKNGNLAPQTIQFSNPTNQTQTVTSKLSFATGTNWFTATASAGTTTPVSPLTETVSVNAAGLAPGVYLGSLDLHVAESNTDFAVSILLIVPKAACTPSLLLPVFTNLTGGFRKTAGLPISLNVQVVDDCGSPIDTGFVEAYFGAADAPVSLTATGSGKWEGAWLPHNIGGGSAFAGLNASSAVPVFAGSSGVSGTLVPNPSAPLIFAGGVTSAASLAPDAPIAPGTYISIFGANLGQGSTSASALPLPTRLGATRVLLGGEALPLQFVGNGQVNAVVPYDIAVNSAQQLLVEVNGQNAAYSLPETIVTTQAQPSVFTLNQSGKGQGAIQVVKPNGVQFVNGAGSPASTGDALVIYCTGLGAVSPAVPAGAAAPLDKLSNTVNTVTVTIGGQPASVFFAGLAPGFAGLYQVNAIVPAGIASGPAIPVVVSTAGASSPPVTVVLQ